MNIIILGVRIIEDSDNRGSDNRGCTVVDFCVIIIIIIIIIFIIINFFRRVFSKYTEANSTSLITQDPILPEKYTFIIGLSCPVWTMAPE